MVIGGGDLNAGSHSVGAVISADDASSVGGSKDDEDDDDDDDGGDDKVEAGGDPERLKAFNVRFCWNKNILFLHSMKLLMLLHSMMTFSVSSRWWSCWWSCFESPFHPLGIFRKPSPVLGS